ncbi:hypothetical protein [Guptibacillus hwajinpoensis]|uniref:hypothetical protein n=1 Tax=Guptibacillus hwajinpoensis TaxID=208199 RepID=UPI003735DC74
MAFLSRYKASQLGFAIVWASLGLLGLKQVPFTGKQLLAVIVILAGMLVFKISGKKELKRERTA